MLGLGSLPIRHQFVKGGSSRRFVHSTPLVVRPAIDVRSISYLSPLQNLIRFASRMKLFEAYQSQELSPSGSSHMLLDARDGVPEWSDSREIHDLSGPHEHYVVLIHHEGNPGDNLIIRYALSMSCQDQQPIVTPSYGPL